MRPTAILVLALLVVAGCAAPAIESPDAVLPGVRTETFVADDFRCGELLFAQGCVIVRIEHVDSGCSPEVGRYIVCNATLEWTAESGAVAPGSRLSVVADGSEVPGCEPSPGIPCKTSGVLNHTHHFGGPGQNDNWSVVVQAHLSAPGDPPPATGEFSLAIEMRVRTEGASALAS
jgi:hypothetical protein